MPSIRRPRTTAALVAALATAGLLASQVLAAPPTATFTISDGSPVVGQTVEFTASVQDEDGDGTAGGIAWDFNYTGTFTEDATGPTASTSYPSTGAKTIAMRVIDGVVTDGQPDEVTAVQGLTVVPQNQAPTAAVSCTPAAINQGDPVTCTSAGSTDDAGITSREWQVDDGAFVSGGLTFSPTLAPGNHTITLRVTDAPGLSATASDTVSVNALPIANISILNSARETGQKLTQPLAGQPFAFTALAVPALAGSSPAPGCLPIAGSAGSAGSSDAGGSIAKYEWDLNGNPSDGVNGFEVDSGTSASTASPGNGYQAGNRTARLRVTDNNGGTAIATLNFRVNSEPIAQFLLEPNTPIINQSTKFSSTSLDPDAVDNPGALTYSWDLDGDGAFCEAGENGPNVARAFPTAGHYPITLKVTDTGGITRTVTRSVTVQTTIPNASISFSPSAPAPGTGHHFPRLRLKPDRQGHSAACSGTSTSIRRRTSST